ncbi:MAG TPA: MFS transporter [Solirubrobacteraceae bacterium]|nr:MFS transporter [Solirubrobacteraceae bacterium]
MSARHGSKASAAVAETLRSPNLRRAQLSFGFAWAAEWAVTVALAILAFRDGGVAAVGLVAMARMLPAALLAPFAATLVDRYRREHVLAWVGLVRGVTLGAAALSLVLMASPVTAYVLAAVATLAHTLYRPAHSALLPTLAQTPVQLTSANVVRGLLDSVSALLGPLAAGLLVGPTGVSGVLAAAAAAALWSGFLVSRVRYEAAPRIVQTTSEGALAEVLEGLKVLGRRRDVALPALLFNAQTFTRGLMTVFTVVVALELLHTGEAGVGLLTAAFGAGAVLGSLAAALLIGSGNFARWLGVGIALWGMPFAFLAGASDVVMASLLMAIVGVANAICDVSGFTLLQRVVPDEVAGRCFASLEALFMLTVAAGSIAAPAMIALLGTRGALVAGGLIAPVTALLASGGLRRIDQHLRVADSTLDALRRVPLFSPLPLTTVAALGAAAAEQRVEAGATVVQEGETGDDFYVIAEGKAVVMVGGTVVNALGTGDCFGEIAALGRRVRTSSVHAEGDLALLRLGGAHFVRAVTGYTPSRAAAGALVEERLARGAAQAPLIPRG